jgi:hypothetical protein
VLRLNIPGFHRERIWEHTYIVCEYCRHKWHVEQFETDDGQLQVLAALSCLREHNATERCLRAQADQLVYRVD